MQKQNHKPRNVRRLNEQNKFTNVESQFQHLLSKPRRASVICSKRQAKRTALWRPGADLREVDCGDHLPLKPSEVILFAMALQKSENSNRDINPFCCPLFCLGLVVKILHLLTVTKSL